MPRCRQAVEKAEDRSTPSDAPAVGVSVGKPTGDRMAAAWVHGERRTYACGGCRCDACTAAHRVYRQRYRDAYRAGRPPLGARISAAQTWRIIRALLAERYTKRALATALGLRGKSGALKLGGNAVTVRNALKVRRLYRQIMREPLDAPAEREQQTERAEPPIEARGLDGH